MFLPASGARSSKPNQWEFAMKKQTKNQTVTKRHAAKSTTPPKAKYKTKPAAMPTVKRKKSKPVAAKTLPPQSKPKKAKPTAKPKKVKLVVPAPPIPVIPVAESVKPVMATLPAPDHSERDELRRIEHALAEAENAIAGNTGQPVTINPVSAVLITDITELLEELIDTASPKLASTVSRLAYVLCEVMPDLQAVSKRADITLCRKCGVTFGWDRQTEAERAVRSGKYQKSIVVS